MCQHSVVRAIENCKKGRKSLKKEKIFNGHFEKTKKTQMRYSKAIPIHIAKSRFVILNVAIKIECSNALATLIVAQLQNKAKRTKLVFAKYFVFGFEGLVFLAPFERSEQLRLRLGKVIRIGAKEFL
jgi:hypothetical protein